jgi:hypothetical protein
MVDDNAKFGESGAEFLLAKIAQLLGMSTQSLLESACGGGERSGPLTRIEQARALLHAFERVADAPARERCIAYVRAAAEQHETDSKREG